MYTNAILPDVAAVTCNFHAEFQTRGLAHKLMMKFAPRMRVSASLSFGFGKLKSSPEVERIIMWLEQRGGYYVTMVNERWARVAIPYSSRIAWNSDT